jgi:triphosphatase
MKKYMSAEIELKYLLPENTDKIEHVVDKVTALLSANNIGFNFSVKNLCNDYFDTPNLDLRKMDIGLRIRTVDNQFEQTIKTSGSVVDGLHQRPEYNVELQRDSVDLSLFPAHIWPEAVDLTVLQKSLSVVFTTNFIRKTWLIHQGDNIVELALDKGDICVDGYANSLQIHEIEIELVKGEKQALYDLAAQLKAILDITAGNLSKAARGYSLYHSSVA